MTAHGNLRQSWDSQFESADRRVFKIAVTASAVGGLIFWLKYQPHDQSPDIVALLATLSLLGGMFVAVGVLMRVAWREFMSRRRPGVRTLTAEGRATTRPATRGPAAPRVPGTAPGGGRGRSPWGLLMVGGALLFLVSLPVRSPWLSVLAAGLFVLPFIVPIKPAFRFNREMPRRAMVGVPVPARYTVTNASRMSSPPTVVTDPIPGFAPTSVALPPLRPGESAALDVGLLPTRRSWTDDSWLLTVRQSGWFAGSVGLLQKPVGHAPIVWPRLLPLPGPLPLLSREIAGAGPVRVGEGTDVHGIRPWHPGDAPRQVHWRSTARVGSPMVLEREEEYSREVVLLIADSAPDDAWEDGISRAAWVVRAAHHQGCDLRVFAGVRASRRPDPSWSSTDDVLDWFAGLETVGHLDLAPVRTHLRRAAGSVVVLSSAPSLAQAVREIGPRVRVI